VDARCDGPQHCQTPTKLVMPLLVVGPKAFWPLGSEFGVNSDADCE